MRVSAVLLVAAVAAAPAHATVNYAIDLTAPEHHTANVRIEFPAADGETLDVKMPAWRTGRYQILNLANGVRRFSAHDGAGRPLTWQKIDKSTWRIRKSGPGPVRVSYEVYGNELGLRSRHIDDSHAYLDASATFMYADRFRAEDVAVSLKVPPRWRSFSGMASPAPQRFVAPNWDVLVDSPIETGIQSVASFKEGGREYQVTVWGKGNYDIDQMAADLRKIVAQAPSIWRAYPFQRYVFMVHATDGVGGATEHLNSTIIQMPRYMFQPRGNYVRFLSTAAHEFIHTWNVKAYRPAGLVPYEYQRENYSDLLWIAEGSTDYFADHFMLRAGLIGVDDYLGGLSEAIEANRHRPGRLEQSVAASSFDEWISTGDGDRQQNAWVNIYSEGLLTSWALDIALLQQTGGRVSYRDVHRLLHERFDARSKGFTNADVLAILSELTGKSWDAWWAANVYTPVAHDFDALLAPVGLRLDQPAATRAWAGWQGSATDVGIRLTQVERGSPAWNAGFTKDDVIVAIDGQRMTNARFNAIFGEREPGAAVRVSYFRRDELSTKTMKLGAAPASTPRVVPVAQPTAAQKALFERWLLVPHPSA